LNTTKKTLAAKKAMDLNNKKKKVSRSIKLAVPPHRNVWALDLEPLAL